MSLHSYSGLGHCGEVGVYLIKCVVRCLFFQVTGSNRCS